MEQLFRKAKQNRVFQDVVAQIQAAILDGEIAAGTKLPPERDLCELFQTSRGTLREALRILEQKGLIEIRLGVNGGAYVRDLNSELMTENLAMLIRSNAVALEHLAEFREGVEGDVAALAARHATAEDIAVLRELVARAGQLRAEGLARWPDFVRIDEQVHLTIARIAANPLYTFVLKSVHDNIHLYYDKFLRVGDQEMEENDRDLGLLVEAVASGQPDRARELARAHVLRFSAYMQDKRR